MKTILLVLILNLSALGQAEWQFLGYGFNAKKPDEPKTVFYIDDSSIIKTKDEVIFKAFYARFTAPENADSEKKLILSTEYYIFSVVQGNCRTYKYTITLEYGRWGTVDNKPNTLMHKFERNDIQAVKGNMAYKALRFACSDKPYMEKL